MLNDGVEFLVTYCCFDVDAFLSLCGVRWCLFAAGACVVAVRYTV